jgi:hypothetical protein
MANYVNLAELKTVLGVGDLYPDAQLTSVSTAATNLILSMLSRFQYPIDQLGPEETGQVVPARTVGFHNCTSAKLSSCPACQHTLTVRLPSPKLATPPSSPSRHSGHGPPSGHTPTCLCRPSFTTL